MEPKGAVRRLMSAAPLWPPPLANCWFSLLFSDTIQCNNVLRLVLQQVLGLYLICGLAFILTRLLENLWFHFFFYVLVVLLFLLLFHLKWKVHYRGRNDWTTESDSCQSFCWWRPFFREKTSVPKCYWALFKKSDVTRPCPNFFERSCTHQIQTEELYSEPLTHHPISKDKPGQPVETQFSHLYVWSDSLSLPTSHNYRWDLECRPICKLRALPSGSALSLPQQASVVQDFCWCRSFSCSVFLSSVNKTPRYLKFSTWCSNFSNLESHCLTMLCRSF